MKRILLSLIAFVPIMAMAQDRIHTIKGETINAVIVEIGDESIVYKDFEDQDGPTYRLSVNKIISIDMQSGTRRVFNNLPSGFVLPKELDTHRGVHIMGDDKEMPDSYLPNILGETDYKILRSGIRQKKTGRVLTWVGVGLTVLGAAAGGATLYNHASKRKNKELNKDEKTIITSSAVLVGVGVPMFIVGIPVGSSGGRKINEVIDNYNHKQQASIGIGATANGFGFALAF